MHELLSIYLPVYFLLFFGLAFLWRSWRTYRITGINPYRLPDNPGAEQVTSRYFRLLPFMSLTVMVMYLLPGTYNYLAPIAWLVQPFLQWLGPGDDDGVAGDHCYCTGPDGKVLAYRGGL